jgi:hypothetical protein
MVAAETFGIALDLSALGIIASRGTIVICHIRWPKRSIPQRRSFPAVRHAVRELRHAGIPLRGDRADVLRELLEPGGTHRDCAQAGGRLVRSARPSAPDLDKDNGRRE